MFRPSRRALGATFIAAVVAGIAVADPKGGVWKPVLTESEFAAMVTADAKAITDALAKGKPDKTGVMKARSAALMIVAYCQGAMAKDGAKAAELAALRDKAMAVAQAITDD